MIGGILALGKACLAGEQPFLEALVREELPDMNDGQEGYIAVLHLQLDPLRLELETWEADSAKLSQVLWVGNAPSNNPQDRLTTDKVGYLVSQTVPNLLARLPKEGRLYRQLKRLAEELYIDLGEREEVFQEGGGDSQYNRYRRMWDLTKLGIANADYLSKKQRQEIEILSAESGATFLSMPFLRAYASNKKSAEKVVELVAKVVEGWVREQLSDIRREQIALYTLKLNGQLLAEDPDYRVYLEGRLFDELFREAKSGICHLCSRQAAVTPDTSGFRLLKFYITDKLGFASNLDEKGFARNYALCRECYRALMAGERFTEQNLRTRMARMSVFIIPTFHLPEEQPKLEKIKDWASYLRDRLAATQTFEEWHTFQSKLEVYQEMEKKKGSFVLNLFFAERSRSAVKVQKLIENVPPSRLDQLDEARVRTHDFGNHHFGFSRQWDLSLGRMFYLFPIRQSRRTPQPGRFLVFLDALLVGRPVAVQDLIMQFLETARVHRFQLYGSYVHSAPASKELTGADQALTSFLLQSQLLLYYLQKLGQLYGLAWGGETVADQQGVLPESVQRYFEELGLEAEKRALFLLGYLVAQVASEQWRVSHAKPVLNKIGFSGMDRGKVVRLANEIYDKLRQYKIAHFNEGIYAAMKGLLDRERSRLNSPPENTYWILSGYAYGTQQRLTKGAKDAN